MLYNRMTDKELICYALDMDQSILAKELARRFETLLEEVPQLKKQIFDLDDEVFELQAMLQECEDKLE